MAGPANRAIAWRSRLEIRVVAGVVVAIALSIAAVLTATRRTVTARSLERAGTDLEVARSAFYSLLDDRTEFAAAQTTLVTALPVFRSYMVDPRLAGDTPTLQAMTDENRHLLKADFLIVTDRNGRWSATSGWPTGANPANGIASTIAAAVANKPARDVAELDDRLFLAVSEPARFADELIGTLTAGYALDDELVRRLAGVAHCEVNLVSPGRLYASSLPSRDRQELMALAGKWLPQDSAALTHIGTAEYVANAFPLAPGSSVPGGRLLLLQDWQPTALFVNQVQRRVLGAGALIFVVAVGGSYAFSRRLTRPVQDLAEAADDIAHGNWTRQVPERGTGEAALMARAVNEMTSSLRHWFEEAKKRDDELRQAQKLEAIGRLAGGVAHDFNNLLTAIKGYGELVLEATPPGDPRHEDVDEILKAADRAAGLTRQLLAFSRRQVVAPRVIALQDIVADTEKMLRRLIGEDVRLATFTGADIPLVKVDPGQIGQVLLNLAVNARDAMPSGGKLTIRVERVTIEHVDYARMTVADTGCGMPPEVVAHIFEPFFTTKGEGRGTGLGLATVYGIIDQAGGRIEVETEVDRGTAFHVYLPRAHESATGPMVKPQEAADLSGSETILLVEDEARVGALMASALRKFGYAVIEADNGHDALRHARSHTGPIDLLLTDVVMPGMNGRELAEQLNHLGCVNRVLYMSGYSDDDVLRAGVATAGTQFLQKPFSMEELAAKVREALGVVPTTARRQNS